MTLDLTSRYLGIALRNPLVVSSCPLTGSLPTLERLEAVGAGAVVLPSLFEEQLQDSGARLRLSRESGAAAAGGASADLPAFDEYNRGVEEWFKHLAEAKRALSIPVIASLNAASPGGWVSNAKRIEDAGADALELNIYLLATDSETTSAEVEARYVDLVATVRQATKLPLAVKIGPYFAALPNLAKRLVDAGADGLVLFNRFPNPDIDLEHLQLALEMELSAEAELRLPLRWIGILRSQLSASLAASSGVRTGGDALKLLLAGADATMIASALLEHGPGHLAAILEELRQWLERHHFTTLEEIKGSMSKDHAPGREAYERANYVKTLISYTAKMP
ncbi:MAG TPA: dihydroorotate dehydrogenase-like protein [Pirellulales bacterium]|nr:dihydroorotate dehydrogenase-like protein [Pirellulales bacterium]